MSRDAWAKLDITNRGVADALKFDCEPAMERRIEALAVRDQKFWIAFGDLLQAQFFGNELSQLFMEIVQGFSHGVAVPDHTAARDLALRSPDVPEKKRSALLAHIDAVYTEPLIGAVYTTTIVKDMARKRAIRAAVVCIAKLNERSGGDDPTDEIVEVMQAALSIGSRNVNPTIDLQQDIHMLAQWVSAYGRDSVPTFIDSLDQKLRGGLLPGELGVVLAPPHRGKSLSLVNFGAGALACGRSVLYLSLEDGLRGIIPRVYSRLTGIPTHSLNQNIGKVTAELQQLMPFFHASFRVAYRPPRRTGLRDIKALLEQLQATDGFRPELLIIDYADRLRPPRRRKDQWLELLDIYMDLCSFANENDIAIWTASQTGRGGFSKDVVDLDDFGGSFAKAAEASVVLAYCQTPKERDANEARYHLAKMRNRESGQVVHLYVNRETSTITEVPQINLGQLVWNQKKSQPQQGRPPAVVASPFPGAKVLP